MADKSAEQSTEKAAAVVQLRDAGEFVAGYNLSAIELYIMNVSQEPPSGGDTEGKATFTGHVYLAQHPGDNAPLVVFASYSARREPSRAFGAVVNATYLCVVDIAPDVEHIAQKRKVAEQIARYNGWQKFRDLLGFIVVQGGFNIPNPPNALSEVTWSAVPLPLL